MNYPHRYKFGKQKTILPLTAFEAAMKDAVNRGEELEALAYVTLLWYYGVRKSEGYERRAEDVTIEKERVIIDFGERKKHGLEVPPNEALREWYGIDEFLVPWVQQRQKAKATKKSIFREHGTGKYRVTKPSLKYPNGAKVEIKVKLPHEEKAVWLFPHIASTSAWSTFKRILGEKYYPHYARLWRLSKAAQTAENIGDMISATRRVSGLKSVSAMESYWGDDEEVGKRAMRELK